MEYALLLYIFVLGIPMILVLGISIFLIPDDQESASRAFAPERDQNSYKYHDTKR